MLITPILAKALSSVNSIGFFFLETDQSIALSLPFSWQVFFFCALSFSFANVIYILKCPPLVRKYNNFADFKTKEDSRYFLVNYLKQHASDKMVRENALEIGVIVAKYTPSHDIATEWTSNDTSNVNWKKGIDSLKHTNFENMPDIFSSFRILLAKINPAWIKVCAFFYVVGFLGVAIVVAQNISYVYGQLQF